MKWVALIRWKGKEMKGRERKKTSNLSAVRQLIPTRAPISHIAPNLKLSKTLCSCNTLVFFIGLLSFYRVKQWTKVRLCDPYLWLYWCFIYTLSLFLYAVTECSVERRLLRPCSLSPERLTQMIDNVSAFTTYVLSKFKTPLRTSLQQNFNSRC